MDVFPNPASDQLNISLPEAGEYQIRIYDMNGRMTHSHQFTGKQTTIDIRTSPLGTYTYQLWNNAGRVASGLWLKR